MATTRWGLGQTRQAPLAMSPSFLLSTRWLGWNAFTLDTLIVHVKHKQQDLLHTQGDITAASQFGTRRVLKWDDYRLTNLEILGYLDVLELTQSIGNILGYLDVFWHWHSRQYQHLSLVWAPVVFSLKMNLKWVAFNLLSQLCTLS